MSKKIAILLAEGFEETEALVTCDVLRRVGFAVQLVGIVPAAVTGAHHITVQTDRYIADLLPDIFDAVVLPGGMPGSTNLRDSSMTIDFVKRIYANGKVTAAICAAPMVLARAGLLEDKRFTGYPGMEQFYGADKPNGKIVETDDNIVTGRGPGATFAFAAAIAAALGEKAAAERVLKEMLVLS